MDYTNLKQRMEKSIGAYQEKLSEIRAGRANPSMVSSIMVEYYGTPTPIQSLANITVPEARQLFIKPFDKSCLKDVERAINEANIGITPTNNGEMIILTVPELTEEKRRDYVKQVKSLAEDGKVALRNAREDARNNVKKAELPEDEENTYYEEIQELINKYNKVIEEKVKIKENELMTV